MALDEFSCVTSSSLYTVCTNHRKYSKHLVAVCQYLHLEIKCNLINKKNLHLCIKWKMDSWTVDVIQHQWKNNNVQKICLQCSTVQMLEWKEHSQILLWCPMVNIHRKKGIQSVQMTWLWGESKEAYRFYKMYPLYFRTKYGQMEYVICGHFFVLSSE